MSKKQRKVPSGPAAAKSGRSNTAQRRIWQLEHRRETLISRRRFAARMGLAIALWFVLTLGSLVIGMSGYGYFENMSLTDAYVNAAMILSGMGPIDDIKTVDGKLFAGTYAIFSGLIILIATGFVLAPVFHRVLHKFHVEDASERD